MFFYLKDYKSLLLRYIATALGLRPPERQIFPDQLLSYCNIRVLLYKHTLTVRKTALRLDSSNPRVK